MEKILTPSNIMFAIGIIGLLFTLWNKIQNPQTRLERQQAVDKIDDEGKAKILEQRVQWEKESTEKKFSEVGVRLENVFVMAKNDISHVDAKVEVMMKDSNAHYLDMTVRMTRLETMINERLPPKI